MYLANSILEGNPYEWVSISKTGRMIESINNEIVGIARDAAFLWWLTGEQKYATAAASVFDVYMTGLYYRNVPVDLNYGHQQTLVGMTSFEVIHEDVINSLVPLYDFLYAYLQKEKPEKMTIYADAETVRPVLFSSGGRKRQSTGGHYFFLCRETARVG